jgi:hypothetical protein
MKATNHDVRSQKPRGSKASLLVTYGKLNCIENKIFLLAETKLLNRVVSSTIVNYCVTLLVTRFRLKYT